MDEPLRFHVKQSRMRWVSVSKSMRMGIMIAFCRAAVASSASDLEGSPQRTEKAGSQPHVFALTLPSQIKLTGTRALSSSSA